MHMYKYILETKIPIINEVILASNKYMQRVIKRLMIQTRE